MIDEVIIRLRAEIKMVFDNVSAWFKVNESLLHYKPKSGGWSVGEILEHISITNHFLLILIKKGTAKAIERAGRENYTDLLNRYEPDWERLNLIGEHQSFQWNRPEHMEPTGLQDLNDVEDKLHRQVLELLECLDQLKNGEGVLYKTTMSVHNLGKIDVYHFMYFLTQHAKRHLRQMEKVGEELQNLK